MSGQCNSPCATINERRRGMMNKFQGLIDCYDNQPYKDRMRCPPATLREFPTLVERSQLMACYPVCCPTPCDPCPPCSPCPPQCSPCPPQCSPCPPMCSPCPPCPPPACYPCPPPCYPCPPCPSEYDRNNGNHEGNLDSRELRGGVLYTGCDCVKRNGLQHDCRRSECQGSPECLVKPWPDCRPSGGTGTHRAPPRVSNYPYIEENCSPPPPRDRGPPVPDHEHRAGITCEECEPPIKYSKPTYNNQCPPVECPKPKLSHHPTAREPPEHTELKGGQLLTRCDCIRTNGLQDDCRLHECGIPECLFKPLPECIPSGGRGPQGGHGNGTANGLDNNCITNGNGNGRRIGNGNGHRNGNGNGHRYGNGHRNGNGNGRSQKCLPVCYQPCPSACPQPNLENCLVMCVPCNPCKPC